MKKKLILIPFLFYFLFANTQTVSENIKSQAEKMVTAFKDENYNSLLDYTYPKILEIAGGKVVLESMVKQMMDDMKADGVFVDSAKVGEPGAIFQAGSELHSTITQTVYMKYTGGRMISESTLLAVSMDAGLNWYFLDIKQLTPAMKTQFFPEFNSDLVIPEPKPLTTINDEN